MLKTKINKILAKEHRGKFNRQGVEVEIVDVEEMKEGVQVFARAWRNGKQVGFGKDGSVDIERFRLFNPPITVADKEGEIVKKNIDIVTGEEEEMRFREDPQAAIKEILLGAANSVGKISDNIKAGKIGNTTSIFYSTVGDGKTFIQGTTWEDSKTGTAGVDYATTRMTVGVVRILSDRWQIRRNFLNFDTSALEYDTIDSAQITLRTYYRSAFAYGGRTLSIGSSTNESSTILAPADHFKVGDVKLSNDVWCNSAEAEATKVWTLTATGLGEIKGDGLSKFCIRDVDRKSVV